MVTVHAPRDSANHTRRILAYRGVVNDSTTRIPPPPKPIFQVYRGAVRGRDATEKRDALARFCDRVEAIGLPAVCFHGFPVELANAWDGLARVAQNRGLLALASWGLDDESITATRKGELVGDVLARSTCAAGLADAEGRWDSDTGATDTTDKAGALAFGEALRAKAPDALLGDQSWFSPANHSGFPFVEFARKAVNWTRFPQMYCNEAGFKSRWGTARYEKVRAWMEREWAVLNARLRAQGVERPCGVTLQAYGWDDCPSDLVDALLVESSAARPAILWSDPFPTELVVTAVRFVLWCEREGFATVGGRPTDAVKAAQTALNRVGASLTVDGFAGNATLTEWSSLAAK